MKEIYILLTSTNTIYARAIRLYTKKSYTHSSIALDDSLNNMYSMTRKYYRNPFLGVFKKEEIDKGVFSFYPECPAVVIKLKVNAEQHNEIRQMIWDFNKKKIKYNLRGIFYRVIKKEYSAKDRFFCSELIAYILKETEVFDFEKPLNFVEPSDLLTIPDAEVIYQGPLANYSIDNLQFTN
ncbi:hypothetical protein [Clostridium sp. YIM B02551]|uniref:hypothetical protein n=1 Tax=Clostridium sp. YIM B02551 TaxID=2910679 RepID=UPI001EEADDB3|nr:hypothetical protein [Clostridium sp. YIM B02551]